MCELIKNEIERRDYQEESFLFSKVAEICRKDMFKNQLTLNCSFMSYARSPIFPQMFTFYDNVMYGPNGYFL